MVKRIFVWFLMLSIPLLVSVMSQPGRMAAGEGKSVCEKQQTFSSVSDLVFDEICETSATETGPIIRAEEFLWRENLGHLLRHRLSSYRFVFLECGSSIFFHFPQKQIIVRSTPALNRLASKILTLPDYYCFLHRLCPF